MQRNTEYFCLEPAKFRLDGGAMFGIIPKPLWNKVHPSDEQNRIDLALRLILIKDENKNILIDTGIGDHNSESFNERFDVRTEMKPLEKALKKADLTPGDITDLILSHLHFDHIGGIGELIDGVMTPIFKNANCHIHKEHYNYAHSPTMRDAGSFHCKNFEPIIKWYEENSKLIWHKGEEGKILDLDSGPLNFKCSHGHTPYLMHPYDDRMIYLADLIPTSNHIHIPWVMGYDISPGVTTKDKEEFLQFIYDRNLTMIYEHDPIYWGGKLTPSKHGFSAGENFKKFDQLAYKIEL
ncbi:MBL fold metallo-hydrolase [Halobacteriovorax sp. JY17]|uniref:MBL fold metallo-hydrolase n=1 Tax=Halobacteriovorax sp. JY17 TaxID=2014617 RepID=UPI000C656CA8|nr:MBL fold metallo-hydrolase [Halobacteriovorax sp. JY17]PIK16114.1 MAG: MBL fold metallo-hydrolase [Halobacteriovorax sp. JY17]